MFRKRTKYNHLAVLNGSFRYYFVVVLKDTWAYEFTKYFRLRKSEIQVRGVCVCMFIRLCHQILFGSRVTEKLPRGSKESRGEALDLRT